MVCYFLFFPILIIDKLTAALERERALRAQLQEKCQNPTLELVETLKAQVRHLQMEKDELVKEEVRRLRISSQWKVQVDSELQEIISDLRVQHYEMSRALCGLRKDAEQAKELKAEYVKMFGEVRGLQEELCVRDRELRDARRQVDEMKARGRASLRTAFVQKIW
ncbi:hypothetical protein CPB85DRAFT_839564 [Mucidula mucida]|nr:hypothetical protein CPB85DRAFT_839564 [Mucidula mucida]